MDAPSLAVCHLGGEQGSEEHAEPLLRLPGPGRGEEVLAGRMLQSQFCYAKEYFTESRKNCLSPEEHGSNCGNHRNESSSAYILLISSIIVAHGGAVINRHSVEIFTESIFTENNSKEKIITINNSAVMSLMVHVIITKNPQNIKSLRGTQLFNSFILTGTAMCILLSENGCTSILNYPRTPISKILFS